MKMLFGLVRPAPRRARNRVARLRESLLSPPAAAAPPPPQVESASTSAAVSGSGEPRLVPSGAAAAAAAATASRSGMLVAVEGGIARRRHDGLLECFAWVAVMSLETGQTNLLSLSPH